MQSKKRLFDLFLKRNQKYTISKRCTTKVPYPTALIRKLRWDSTEMKPNKRAPKTIQNKTAPILTADNMRCIGCSCPVSKKLFSLYKIKIQNIKKLFLKTILKNFAY